MRLPPRRPWRTPWADRLGQLGNSLLEERDDDNLLATYRMAIENSVAYAAEAMAVWNTPRAGEAWQIRRSIDAVERAAPSRSDLSCGSSN